MTSAIKDRLAEVRTKLGETQKTMSTRFGLGASTWQGYELEGRLPKTETLTALAELGFNVQWLLTGQGQMMVGDASSPEVSDVDRDARVQQLAALLAAEKEKTKAWIEGAKSLLAGCIMAVDQMAAEQRIRMSPKQRASAITAMFIELGSLSDDEIHAMAADAQKNDGKSEGGRR